MMMKWYLEHPIDGIEVARSISVGLPPDDTEGQQTEVNQLQVGHIVPEADREVKKVPLSIARISSIPAFDMNEQESIKPALTNGDDGGVQSPDYDAQSVSASQVLGGTWTIAKRHSLAAAGVNLDMPFGLSPFSQIIEVGSGEVSLSSQPKTLSRANLLASGAAISIVRDFRINSRHQYSQPSDVNLEPPRINSDGDMQLHLHSQSDEDSGAQGATGIMMLEGSRTFIESGNEGEETSRVTHAGQPVVGIGVLDSPHHLQIKHQKSQKVTGNYVGRNILSALDEELSQDSASDQ